MASYEEDIRQSLEILFSTGKGERVMLPEYGSDLRELLFDAMDNTRLNFVRELVRMAVLRYEPRIDLIGIELDSSDFLDGVLYIQLDYTVRKTNTRSNMVYPFYFIEGTDLPSRDKQVARG